MLLINRLQDYRKIIEDQDAIIQTALVSRVNRNAQDLDDRRLSSLADETLIKEKNLANKHVAYSRPSLVSEDDV